MSYNDFCNSSGGIGYHGNPAYSNSVCYNWNNTNECDESYHVNNACYHDVAFYNFGNHSHTPHTESFTPFANWGDMTFHTNVPHSENPHTEVYSNWSWYHQIGGWDAYGDDIIHTEVPWENTSHSEIPAYDNHINVVEWDHIIPFFNWANYSETLGFNFCNHADQYTGC